MADHHDHDHGHHHGPADYHRAFAIGVVLNVVMVAAEIVFGVLSGSLALLADAGHNLSDVLGLLLSWGASMLGRRQPTERHTYGLRRTSILAALSNAVILLIAVGGIAWEAVRRLIVEPEPIASGTVMVVAGLGIVINTITALLFRRGRKRDLNIQGAFLHMAGDAAVSLGVVVAALVMRFTGWLWLDPLVSLAIVLIIMLSTWGLLRESLNLALDAVPKGVDRDAVAAYLTGLPGIAEVHDLHIWGMSTTETALTAHLIKPEPAGDDQLLLDIADELREHYGIKHTTLQFERSSPSQPCHLLPTGAKERD